MEQRYLGGTGFRVPALSLGTATFGGGNEFFKAWGDTDVKESTRMVDMAYEMGINFLDTANVYSDGLSEEIVGETIKGRRSRFLLSTKATFRLGQGPNDVGSSRFHLLNAVEDSLKRLKTDYIDVYHMHGFDAKTPVEETLSTLDQLVKSGKVRYIACSNFSGWHLMKSLSVSERYGWSKYVAHQVYYSLVGRDYESELMPLALDQNVGAMIWSPLGWGRLTGKLRRGAAIPEVSRLHKTGDAAPPIDQEYLYQVVDVLDQIAQETGKSIPQISLNWLLQRPTVSNVIVGARNEEQLKQNLGATGWKLSPEQMARLDQVSQRPLAYPYYHQRGFEDRNPFPVPFNT